MKLAVVGSREFPDLDLVWIFVEKVAKARPDTIIVSGGARGVDTVAAAAARMAGLQVEELIPDWNTHGILAGFERNSRIIESCDRVVAFWDLCSRGTADTLNKVVKQGKPHIIFGPNGRKVTLPPR